MRYAAKIVAAVIPTLTRAENNYIDQLITTLIKATTAVLTGSFIRRETTSQAEVQ